MIMSWSEKNLLPTEREHWSDHLVIYFPSLLTYSRETQKAK